MNKKVSQIISIIIIANIIRFVGIASGITSIASITRVIYAFMAWGILFIYPYRLFKYNDFGKLANFIIKALLLLSIYQVFVALFNNDPILNNLGNKYITLFTVPDCALSLLAPLFIYFAMAGNLLKKLLSSFRKFTYLQIPLLPFINFFSSAPFYAIAFKKYTNKKTSFLIILSVFLSLLSAIQGSRTGFVILTLCLVAYFINYTLSSRLLNKLFCITAIVLPFIIFVPMLYNTNDETIFQYYSNNLDVDDEELTADTRSFLYQEMAEDLTNTNSWVMGKGASSYYYSNTFFLSTSDNADFCYRMAPEVSFLNYLLRGGIVYTTLFYTLFIIAILLAAFKGKSKFIRCIGALLASFYFIHFVSTFHSFGFPQFVMFVFMGCCLSKTWLGYSNKDINEMFKTKK